MTKACDVRIDTAPKETADAPGLPDTVPTSRLLLAWGVMLGGLVGFWCLRPYCTPVAWGNATAGVLWVTSKFATLVCLPGRERRRLSWARLVAYLFWPGMQPSHFLPESTPAATQPAPTVGGLVLNLVTAGVFLWVLPGLLPADAPQWLRVVSGGIGHVFLILFALFDAWALLYRACGFGVEKLWHCPIAATSLTDFWGQRWNRIFSGMLRGVLFRPLARRLGAGFALFAVFLYSGLLHENLSVMALSGYGLPTLYFLIQGLGTWLESRCGFRRAFRRLPWLGRVWTAAVVLGPVTLLMHAGYREQFLVPTLAAVRVPGLELSRP
jgi:alginate O-acetyltransferase complex protein AlgI